LALTPGTRLGVYEVTTQIGAGGMGEVYRATDSHLKRSVAIKVLPASMADDADRLARFQREAEVLAALNHPNIAAIYGLEKTPDFTALVMELVEGEDLADRIARGPMPLDEALPIGRQIAEALEAAHDQGIIHRDLKPANVKVRHDGTVKVLDFGLARVMESAGVAASVSQSPAITTPAMTQAGIILGTAAYMSPEQAKGRLLDKRSDVWAFGCVFYEMLTAKRAFDGEDVTDTIAAIVRGAPDWNVLPADVPEQIRLLLRRCLEKDRRARVSDLGVARFLMTETFAAAAPLSPTPPQRAHPRSRRRVVARTVIGVLAILGLLGLAVMAGTRLVPRTVLQPVRFAIVPPPAQPLSIQGTSRDIAISPDGSRIVYRAGVGAPQQLVVRAINELDAKPVAGAQTIVEPFVSADGRWIGFFAGGELRKVAITGGPQSTICRIPASPRGASWVLTTSFSSPLRINAADS
jgi:serine/threonine-protein kinase